MVLVSTIAGWRFVRLVFDPEPVHHRLTGTICSSFKPLTYYANRVLYRTCLTR